MPIAPLSEESIYTTQERLAVIYSAPSEIRVWISGHDENRTPAPYQTHGANHLTPFQVLQVSV